MKRIAVVGSGISGLGAAYALQKCQCDIIVLESAQTVGGRMQTCHADGYTWDPATQFLLDKFSALHSLLAELNVPVTDTLNSSMRVVLPNDTDYYFRLGQPIDMFRHPRLSLWAKFRLLKLFLQTAQRWRQLDFPWMTRVRALDSGENLRTYGDSEYGPDSVDYFMSLPSSNLFFWTPEDTPWWMPMLSIKVLFNSRMRVPKAGMGAVTAALASKLDVRLRHTVRRVEISDDGAAVLQVDGPNGRSRLTVDRVVIATPAPIALKLLADPDLALGEVRANFLRTAAYTSVITTAVAWPSPVERRAFGLFIPQKTGLGLSTIGWEHLKASGRAPIHSALGVLCTSDAFAKQIWQEPDVRIARHMVDLAQVLYPDALVGAQPLRTYRFPHATPIMVPGRSHALHRALAAGPAPASPVFTCGDYWLGPNVEQALITGYRAAGEVLQSLQIPVPDDLHVKITQRL